MRQPPESAIERFPWPGDKDRSRLDPQPFAWPEPQPLASCRPRRRTCCRGEVRSCAGEHHPAARFRAVLADETGEIALVFLGRDAVPGIVEGARLDVEGMVGRARDELAMLNPRYRFVPGAPHSATSW